MKRRISLLILVAVIVSLFTGSIFHEDVYAYDTSKEYEGLYYAIEDGEVTIEGSVSGLSGAVEIPSHIEGLPVTTLKGDAFHFCSITSLYIPKECVHLSGDSFWGCHSIESITVDKDNPEFCASEGILYNKDKTKLVMASQVITGTDFVVPDSVKTIGCEAFNFNYVLETVKLNQVTTLERGAFYDCTALKKVVCGENLEEIGDASFDGCYKLANINLPEGLKSIGYGTFRQCEGLKTLTLPDSLTYIGKEAFKQSGIESIRIPRGVAEIMQGSFSECASLKSVKLFSNIEIIGDKAFESCTSLESIIIPNNVKKIGEFAFDACTSLEIISIPSSVREIGGYGFGGCKNLQEVAFSEGLETIGYFAFYGCNKLEEVYLPDSLMAMEDFVFYSSGIRKIKLSEGMKTIPQQTFCQCRNLKEIVIPKSIDSIGGAAFSRCSSLETISFDGSCPQISGDAFNDVVATAYYPRRDKTWTADKRQDYGGTITWIPTGEAAGGKEIDEYSYSFANSNAAFGYPTDYTIPLSSYQLIYGNNVRAEDMYLRKTYSDIPNKIKRAWEGNCAGMTATSEMLADSTNGINPANFNADATDPKDLKAKDRNAELEIDLTTFIEAMHVAQYTQIFKSDRSSTRVVTSDIRAGRNDLNAFHDAIKAETDAGRPVLLAMMPGDGTGHAILGYAVEDHDDGTSSILIYDNRWPLQELSLTLEKDSSGKYTSWSYNMDANGVEKYGVWGTDQSASNISFVYYDTLMEIWNTRGHLDESGSTNMLTINSDDFTLYSSSGQELARVEKGELVKTSNDIDLMERELSLRKENDSENVIVAPIAVYRVVNNDKSVEQLEVSASNAELGASVNTTASEVVVAVQDSVNYNSVTVCAEPEDTYTVSLKSTLNDDYNEIIATGVGTEEDASISMVGGVLDVEDCALSALVIDGEDQGPFTIKATAEEGGTITPNGESQIIKGEGLTYTITPNAGYAISDVLVDGKSAGAVSTYEFKNVKGAHSIVAKFERTNLYGDANGDNKVDASDLTRLARHLAKIEMITNSKQLENADVNHDGKVSSEDLTKLARYIAKIISSLD